MLIEFSVSNFRSFRTQQTLSMVAAPRLRKKENTLPAPLEGEAFPDLLRVAAIYGPNAAGKSNFIQALQTVGLLALQEPRNAPTAPLIWPFRFDPSLRDAPSRFEIHFAENGLRYMMQLSATDERIVEERLTVYPRGREQLLYERVRRAGVEAYRFGEALEGGADLHETWRKATAPDVLFLSRAVANSNEELQQLRHPLRWLTESVTVVRGSLGVWQRSVQSLIEKYPPFADEVVALLREVDVPITGMRSEAVGAAGGDVPPVVERVM
jgi:AAA domain, putative AbiEii toxin, Type IV TA system